MNVALRPVVIGDAKQIYDWQTCPGIRQFFRNPEPPNWQAHLTWVKSSLHDPNKYLFLIVSETQASGFLYLTRLSRGEFEVSILVSEEYQGKGIAKRALFEVRKLFPFVKLDAEVHPENIASRKLFFSCGFVKSGEHVYSSQPVTSGACCAVRANSGIGVGLGHLRRCLELAKMLREKGWLVVFIEPTGSNAVEIITMFGFSVIFTLDEAKAISESSEGADLLLVDHYDLDLQDISQSPYRTWKLAVFEDIGERPLPANIVINGSPSALKMDLHGLGGKTILAGPKYQIIRADLKQLSADRDNFYPIKILVTIGAGDPNGLLGQLIDLFADRVCSNRRDLAVDIVIGPHVKDLYFTDNDAISIHRSPGNMAELIASCDIAVSAAGQTLMELLYCGKPTIALCLAENQLKNIHALEQEECIISAGRTDLTGWEERLLQSIDLLLLNQQLRHQLSRKGKNLVDGNGAERIANALGDVVAER